MKNHKITITLSHDDFSMLEKLCVMGTRNKSRAIAWLISQEWERVQEEEREKTPAELLEGMKAYASRLEKRKKAADYVAPCYDTQIIQFPVGQIRQFKENAK